jgi:hypothetical protein
MNRKEYQNKVNILITENGLRPTEAVAIVQDQYLNESRQRSELEEINSIEVEKILSKQSRKQNGSYSYLGGSS